MQHVRAAAVLAAALWMFVLATPGLDFLDPSDTRGSKREKLLASGLLGQAHVAVADFNDTVRRPIVRLIEPTQKPFRVSQTWNLYRDGPSRVRRVEVRVDGEVWFRSQDDAHAWRKAQLTTRRMRPMLESMGKDDDAPNWEGLTRWIVAEVLRDDPYALLVEVVATEERFPSSEVRIKHKFSAWTPKWQPRRSR